MGIPYGKFPEPQLDQPESCSVEWKAFKAEYEPTLEEASVNEFSVLDFPALGLPTSPMRGSRGIVSDALKRPAQMGSRAWWGIGMGVVERLR